MDRAQASSAETFEQPGRSPDRTVTRIALLMAFEAATLAVASALHLSGHVHGRSSLFQSDDAGIAEALIGTVLACGAVAMLWAPARARTIGLATTAFAIVGFLVGITITARAGHLPDIAYHAIMLPLLIGSLIVLLRTSDDAPQQGMERIRPAEARR